MTKHAKKRDAAHRLRQQERHAQRLQERHQERQQERLQKAEKAAADKQRFIEFADGLEISTEILGEWARHINELKDISLELALLTLPFQEEFIKFLNEIDNFDDSLMSLSG